MAADQVLKRFSRQIRKEDALILRGIALEVGGHIDRLWQGFWDFVFVVSSFLLAVLFGAAAGNLARGVPLDARSRKLIQ